MLSNYNSVSNATLKEMLPNKTAQGIYKKAYKIGLRKTAEAEYINRSEAKKGSKAANWNGGMKTTKSGYRQILIPEHPRADSCGYVMEHIVVWERATGIPVPESCCIHHLNGDKTDNRIHNLCMMQHTAHTVYHHTGAKRSAVTKQRISEARRKRHV